MRSILLLPSRSLEAMTKRQSKQSRGTQSSRPSTRTTDDMYPDAFERFERAVDIAVATIPIHKGAAMRKGK